MGKVQNHLHQLDDRALRLADCDPLVVSADGLIESLLQTIDEVRCMVRKTVASADAAFTAVQSVGGLASNLTTVMHQLSSQIQIIALNAQVQAAHNCGGTGLEVLAANTGLISTETGEVSESIACGVDSFTAELDDVVGEFGKLRAQAVSWQTRIESEFQAREQTLHDIRNRTQSELNAVTTTLRDITDLVSRMADENQLKAIVGTCFGDFGKSLAECEQVVNMELRRRGAVPDPKKFSERLAAGYSIASEHEIHRRVLGIAAPASAANDSLMGALGAVNPPLQSGEAGSEPAGCEAALQCGADRSVVPALAATTDATKTETMGDNVELF